MDELPNGWHYRRHAWAYEFWWDGKLIHTVSKEAWEDFNSYIRTPGGRRWAYGVVSEAMGLVGA